MRRSIRLAPLALALCLPLTAAANDKLGEAYGSASPAEKLAMLSVARTDNVLDHKETAAEVTAVTHAYVAPGKTPEERLKLLGELREQAQAKLKEQNEGRKAEKKRSASFHEPDGDIQLALSLSYVSSVAGDAPTLEELGCLALVRKSTSWVSTGKLVLALATDAFARDDAYRAADIVGKLSTIKRHAEDREMLSDHERTDIEKAALSEWMSAQLAAGQGPEQVLEQVEAFKSKKQVNFFTYSWARGILQAMAALPPAAN